MGLSAEPLHAIPPDSASGSGRLPRFRGGRQGQFIQQVWIPVETRRKLRRIGAALDRNCPELLREAISDVMAKFATGIAPQPPSMPDRSTAINQTVRITRETREAMQMVALQHRCCNSPCDLVREGIEDLFSKYGHFLLSDGRYTA